MTISAFQILLYSTFVLLPVFGALLGYGILRHFPARRTAIIASALTLLAAAVLSSQLALVYPGPLVRPPGSLAWWLGAISFFTVSTPCWVAMSAFVVLPTSWRRLRWVIALLAGYLSVFPTVFLVLFAACGYAGACL